MLYGVALPLEIRRDGDAVRVAGSFPYNAEAQLGDGRRERFAPGAFRSRVAAGAKIYLLRAHDPEQPLASTEAGLQLRDTDEALHLEARISADTSWARDAIAALSAGLTTGLSPGFRVVQDAVTKDATGILRTVLRADLFEASLVTWPAYPQAQLAARSWTPNYDEAEHAALARTLHRWRP